MITKQIPEFISKYCSLSDKGLFWEMIKIEIRASTIIFAKNLRFTIEFYRFLWNAIGQIMVDNFNYAFENGDMSISQKRGIISLIPKKDRDKKTPQKLETSFPIE